MSDLKPACERKDFRDLSASMSERSELRSCLKFFERTVLGANAGNDEQT